jgi:DNA-binding transcriptional MerR regulator
MPQLFYTAKELGEQIGISADTVINFEEKGYISPSFRDHNNWRRYTQRHKAELIYLFTVGKPKSEKDK